MTHLMKKLITSPLLALCLLVIVPPVHHAEANWLSTITRAAKKAFRIGGDDVAGATARVADDLPTERALRSAMSSYPPVVLPRGVEASPLVDLTERAFRGELVETVGRDIEIRDLMEALAMRSGGYSAVIGDPGVGKSQLIAGLAQEIVADVPSLHSSLRATRVLQLDRSVFTSGASVAGNLDAHFIELKAILAGLSPQQQERVVLVVEDLGEWSGLLQGTGSDIQLFLGRLNELMTSTRVKTILTASQDDFQKIVTNHPLARRLTQVRVEAPSVDHAFDMVSAHLPKLKETYGVTFSPETVGTALRMAQKFDTALELPGSAIRLLERASVYTNFNSTTRPRVLIQLEEQRADLQRRINAAGNRQGPKFEADRSRLGQEISSLDAQIAHTSALHTEIQDYSRLVDEVTTELRSKEQLLASTTRSSDQVVLHQEIDALTEKQEYLTSRIRERTVNLSMGNEVDEQALAQVISRDRGTSVDRILEELGGDASFHAEITEKVYQRIVGQRHVVDTVLRHLYNTKEMTLKGVRGAFLGVGPSQTGKSEFGRALGDIFGQGKVLRINCGDYKDRTAVNALRGANPGYIGYEEGGLLTNFLKRNPDGVIWLDEIEKADTSMFDILLSVLDSADPHILTNRGEKLSTRETIVWMTGNLLQGPQDPFTKRALDAGLVRAEEFSDAYLKTIRDPQQLTEHLQGILTQLVDEAGNPVLRNEVYNRLHGIFKFYEFTASEMTDLVRVMARPLVNNFDSLHIGFSLGEEALEALALRSGRDFGNSARVSANIERFVSSKVNYLRNPPLESGFQAAVKEGDMVHVTLRQGADLQHAAHLSVEEFQSLFEFAVYGLDGDQRVIRTFAFDLADRSERAVLSGTFRQGEPQYMEMVEGFGWNFEDLW